MAMSMSVIMSVDEECSEKAVWTEVDTDGVAASMNKPKWSRWIASAHFLEQEL